MITWMTILTLMATRDFNNFLDGSTFFLFTASSLNFADWRGCWEKTFRLFVMDFRIHRQRLPMIRYKNFWLLVIKWAHSECKYIVKDMHIYIFIFTIRLIEQVKTLLD